MINLRFYFDEYKRQLAEIRIFIQSVELQKDVISEIEFYEKQGEKKLNLSLQYSKIIKQVVETPIQYNAVIISIYGCFEQYMFGSAGSLDCNATDGKFVIPTAAYREEGLSYHYSAPTDYVEIKNAKAVKAIFDELNLPSVTGKVWTRNGVTYNLEKMMSDIHRQEPSVVAQIIKASIISWCREAGR